MNFKEKRCTHCKKVKSIKAFHRRPERKIGYASWCIDCLRNYDREYKQREIVKNRIKRYEQSAKGKEGRRKISLKYYKNNKVKIKERHKKYRDAWLNYFKQKYGDNPKCECCGIKLNWGMGNGKYVVFDHRHGKGNFKQQPGTFFGNHSLSNKNIKIWEEEDFGIICQACNAGMPTDLNNRKQYILNLIKYVCGNKAVKLLTQYLQEHA